MIKGIYRISNLGVFDDYAKPTQIEEFRENNIIYGWNYSGKTTLSRIFQALEHRRVNADYPDAEFSLETSEGQTVSETDLGTSALEVRVFNTDFIATNLRWDGQEFEPILLLGDESIHAQKEIERNESYIERMRGGFQKKEAILVDLDSKLREAKTKSASYIKQTLCLVEAYIATHLNQQIPKIRVSPKDYLISEADFQPQLKKATASDSEKLPLIAYQRTTSQLSSVLPAIADLLKTMPEMTKTIQHFVENNEIARWVKEGLTLHENKDSCEFCGNDLSGDRLKQLHSHFSEDLARHESDVKGMQTRLEGLKLKFEKFHERDFYTAIRNDVESAQQDLTTALENYNKQIDSLSKTLEKKLNSPFQSFEMPSLDLAVEVTIVSADADLQGLVDRNNQITNNFSKEKSAAILALKDHFVAKFCIEQNLDACEFLEKLHTKHRDWYKSACDELLNTNAELEASISEAQKGREELNQFMAKFLSGENIAIEVVKVEEKERFRLTRNGRPARNLSEGEKTAIAFSFFLTKLKECAALEEVVVYIDDPISSLDSNHLFQVNAAIRDFFFSYDATGNPKWTLRVKQIFFSTHNFEFMGLLRRMPINSKSRCSHFYVKRNSLGNSTFIDMPESFKRYNSEYQYLWSVIHKFYSSDQKDDIEVLLALPNAVRRFIELYTYSKIPSSKPLESRANILFGAEKSNRILKVLHHFSHSNNLLGIAQNSDLICDIENVVNDLVGYVQADALHYSALMEPIQEHE